MSLGRYLSLSVLIFFIGIFALYSGINRVPFRQAPHQEHQQKQEHQGNHGLAPREQLSAGGVNLAFLEQNRKGGEPRVL